METEKLKLESSGSYYVSRDTYFLIRRGIRFNYWKLDATLKDCATITLLKKL